MTPAVPCYPWFKAALFALLACNTAAFVLAGTRSEALDATAWLILLALFELETGYGDSLLRGRLHTVIRAARLAAGAAVVAAGVGYVIDGDRLDAVNSGLWIGVVLLLESALRYPRAVAGYRSAFAAIAIILYSGLGALVLAWAWQGAWFDAYDALLWLIAFATIELNLLKWRGGENAVPGNPNGGPPP